MRAVKRWSRRAVLGAAAMVGVGATGLIATRWIGGNSGRGSEGNFPELLRQAISDLDISCNLAGSFLSAELSGGREHDIPGVVALVRERLDIYRASSSEQPRDEQGMGVGGLIRVLARTIKEDFATGQLCVVEGWQLSKRSAVSRLSNFYGNGMVVPTLSAERHLCMRLHPHRNCRRSSRTRQVLVLVLRFSRTENPLSTYTELISNRVQRYCLTAFRCTQLSAIRVG